MPQPRGKAGERSPEAAPTLRSAPAEGEAGALLVVVKHSVAREEWCSRPIVTRCFLPCWPARAVCGAGGGHRVRVSAQSTADPSCLWPGMLPPMTAFTQQPASGCFDCVARRRAVPARAASCRPPQLRQPPHPVMTEPGYLTPVPFFSSVLSGGLRRFRLPHHRFAHSGGLPASVQGSAARGGVRGRAPGAGPCPNSATGALEPALLQLYKRRAGLELRALGSALTWWVTPGRRAAGGPQPRCLAASPGPSLPALRWRRRRG